RKMPAEGLRQISENFGGKLPGAEFGGVYARKQKPLVVGTLRPFDTQSGVSQMSKDVPKEEKVFSGLDSGARIEGLPGYPTFSPCNQHSIEVILGSKAETTARA